jgi:hypothetical protein
MKQYLLSIYQPDGPVPPREVLAKVMQDVKGMIDEAKSAGVWVFNGGLHPPAASTVVQFKGGDFLVTDGPYAEGKEHIGGFMVVKAEDLDGALGWARKLSRALTIPGHPSLPIEVRPFQEDHP